MKSHMLLRPLWAALMLACLAVPSTADERDYVFSGNRVSEAGTLANTAKNPIAPSPISRQHKRPLQTVAGSLAIVLGGFLLLAVLLRKPAQPSQPKSMLSEAMGEIQVTPKVKLHLVRVGNRVLVLHLGANTVERVAEISDPNEVKRLLQGDTDASVFDFETPGPDVSQAKDDSGFMEHPKVDDLLRAASVSPEGFRR